MRGRRRIIEKFEAINGQVRVTTVVKEIFVTKDENGVFVHHERVLVPTKERFLSSKERLHLPSGPELVRPNELRIG